MAASSTSMRSVSARLLGSCYLQAKVQRLTEVDLHVDDVSVEAVRQLDGTIDGPETEARMSTEIMSRRTSRSNLPSE